MSRRAELTDAAIATLARDGMRGLTHRAVDRAAGLPEGSASYYFRTRQALLQATVERLVELDAAEAPPPSAGDLDLDTFVNGAAALVESWLDTGRDRLLARYELCLEANRRPELRAVLETAGAAVRAMVAGQLTAVAGCAPHPAADDFVAFLDGLLFDQVAGAGTRKLTGADLRTLIRGLVTAAGAGPARPAA